jgi:hypothetical protein
MSKAVQVKVTISHKGTDTDYTLRQGLGLQALAAAAETPIEFDCREADCGICIVRVQKTQRIYLSPPPRNAIFLRPCAPIRMSVSPVSAGSWVTLSYLWMSTKSTHIGGPFKIACGRYLLPDYYRLRPTSCKYRPSLQPHLRGGRNLSKLALVSTLDY